MMAKLNLPLRSDRAIMCLSFVFFKNIGKSWLLMLLATFIWSGSILPGTTQSSTEPPTTSEPSNNSQSQFQQIAEEFINLLGKGDYTKARTLLSPSIPNVRLLA